MPILFRLRTAGALLLAALLTTQAAAQHAGRAGQASTTQSVKVVSGDGTIMRPPVIPADDTTLAPPLAPQAAAAAVSGITTDEGLWTFGTPAYASGDYAIDQRLGRRLGDFAAGDQRQGLRPTEQR